MDPIIESAVAWHDVGEPDDFPDGAAWPVAAAGLPVAVFRQGEELFALYDLCSHCLLYTSPSPRD